MPRGRPRKVLSEPQMWQLRITSDELAPKMGEFTRNEVFQKLVLFEEGGEGTGAALHYHGILQTLSTEAVLRDNLTTIIKARGNASYSLSAVHENTQSQSAKHGKLVYLKGYDQSFVDECIAKQEEYLRTHERSKKRKQRSNEAVYDEVVDQVINQHPEAVSPSGLLVKTILMFQADRQLKFPPRTTLESIANKIRWSLGHQQEVVEQYNRQLEARLL